MTLLFRSRNRRWKARNSVSLLALAAFTAALIAVRAAWLPPILYSGRHFGSNLSLASNRNHLFILSSAPAQGTPRVVSFPRSLAYWQLMDLVNLTNEVIDARDGRQRAVSSLRPDSPWLPTARSDVELADSLLRQLVDHLCVKTSFIPSNPMRFGLAFGAFRTATHASHLAYVSWYWIWAMVSAAPVLVLSLSAIRGPKPRPGPGNCSRCGYDMTGNQSGKCPECGIPTSQSEPAALAPARDTQP